MQINADHRQRGAIEEGSVRRTGAHTYRVGRADIGTITHDGREIVRRVFVTVRDSAWREIIPTEWRIEELEPGRLGIEARHQSEAIDFAWRGVFTIEDGAFAFSMEGSAQADTEICRVGLVLLLPDEPLIGASLSAHGPHGGEYLTLSPQIYPQPVVKGVPQAMMRPFNALDVDDGEWRLSLSFTGDLFEMEDQRNWGDASFKIYCTPLAEGFPRVLKREAIIAHTASGRIGARPSGAVFNEEGEPRGDAATSAAPSAFPAIGAVFGGLRAQDKNWRRLRLSLDEASAVLPVLENAPGEAAYELAVLPGQITAPALSRVIEALGARLSDVLLLDGASNRDVTMLRRVLAAAGAKARILSATTGHFVEFNRGKAFLPSVDGLAFPLSPTAHLYDRWTIAENVSALGDMVRTARQLSRAEHIAISPLALFHPPSGTAFPKAMAPAWLAATLSEAATAGVASVTLASDVISTLEEEPVGRELMNRIAQWAGRPTLPLRMRSHPQLRGVVVRLECGRLDALVTNLSAEVATLDGHGVLSGLPLVELGRDARPPQIWRPGMWRLPPGSVFVAA